jgi:hypothetical protein
MRNMVIAVAAVVAASIGQAHADNARFPSNYGFKRVGEPLQNGGIGKLHQTDSVSIVTIRLVRIQDGAAVKDGVITAVAADMGPDGMPRHVARAGILSSDEGVFRLEVHPGMAGEWALHLTAAVPGVAAPIHGTVITALAK